MKNTKTNKLLNITTTALIAAIMHSSICTLLANSTRANNAINTRLATQQVASGGNKATTPKINTWVQGLFNFGKANKEMFQNLNGSYNNFGAILGIDTTLNDKFLGGAAYAEAKGNFYLSNNLDEKVFKTSIKIGSLYGKANLTDDLHFNAIINVGELVAVFEKSIGLKASLLDAEGKFVYDLALGTNVWLRPFLGFGYTSINLDRMVTLINELVNQSIYNNTRVILGTSLSTDITNGDFTISPEAHVGAGLVLNNKTSDADKDGTLALLVQNSLDLGNFFNVGVSTNVSHKNGVEFGVGADLTANKQFNNYSGFLKVKISL